jgi:hypothetical protein
MDARAERDFWRTGGGYAFRYAFSRRGNAVGWRKVVADTVRGNFV